ncbi:Leucine-rich repeat serine/threonine-protein kinase 2 [Stylophora pistillata]|uniref:Leucine-rich repeat serine/threonine-protein kinase 2 n=1 Tax=Stylophora pistillata TaxID=50429 RepID=A0A2B4RB78_STYPI|nr:Leucine-rich repeat serine/threonine-protein kinase 2 [Stylophora pistillata]
MTATFIRCQILNNLSTSKEVANLGISDRCQEKSPVLPGEAVTSIQAQGPRIGSESDMFLVPFAQAGNPGYCEVQHLVAEQFKGEFNQLQDAVNESKGTVVLVSEGYGEKSLVLPCDVSESLRRESVPPKDVVCKLLDISSLRAPAPEDRKWIRCLMRAAKDFDRTDVVNFLREIAPAGTTGPFLEESLSVLKIPIKRRTDLAVRLCGGDEWKIVADKLGFEDAYIRCFDQRFKNPVDLILQHCKLNVGQLYDLLVEFPPEIRARGPLALEAYNNALAEGQTCVKRVPLMFVGQDRSGKTSLKKSLKGICFNPDEDSTVGIDVDNYHFKVTTEIWMTGKKDQDEIVDENLISFEHNAARWIADKLMAEENVADVTGTGITKSEHYDDFEETDTLEGRYPSETTSYTDPSESPRNPAYAHPSHGEPPLTNKEEHDLTPTKYGEDIINRTSRKVPEFEDIAKLIQQILQDDLEDDREDIHSIMWDFAGQSVYYVTHPIFLTRRAIYFLVYDLSRNPSDKAIPLVRQGVYREIEDKSNLKTNMDYLVFWMSSLASLVEPNNPPYVSPEMEKKLCVLPGKAVASIQPQGPSVGCESDMLPVPFAQGGKPGYCQVQPLVAEHFEGEFNQLQDAVHESKGTVVLVSGGYGEKSLVLPCDVSQSLQSESVPPEDVVCKLLDLPSLKAPAPEDRKWIRCLMRDAKDCDRTDVVTFLRKNAPAGTTGGDEWKIVADKLGFEDAYIRCFDQRFKNPVDLILQHCKLDVGQLYDVLVECEFPALADLL